MDIDIEKMICEIEKRPVLWDTTLELYKNKTAKQEAWAQVCCSLFQDYKKQIKEAKIVMEKAVMAKWRTVRDGHVRARKKDGDSRKGETGKKTGHKYVYADLLSFLDTIKTESLPEVSASTGVPAVTPHAIYKKRKLEQYVEQISPVEQNISDYLQRATEVMEQRTPATVASEEDEDMSFFKSMLPTVRMLDQTKKLKFRMQLISSLQTILSEPKWARPESKFSFGNVLKSSSEPAESKRPYSV